MGGGASTVENEKSDLALFSGASEEESESDVDEKDAMRSSGKGAATKKKKKKKKKNLTENEKIKERRQKKRRERARREALLKLKAEETFTMKMEWVGPEVRDQKKMYHVIKDQHPVATILPTHLGKTWSKQKNLALTKGNKHHPHLVHTHDSMMPDPDRETAEEKQQRLALERLGQITLTGENGIDGMMLFEELKRHCPTVDKFLYFDKFQNKWDIEALVDDVEIEKSRGKFKVFSDKEDKGPTDFVGGQQKEGELKLEDYGKEWDEIHVTKTNPRVDVHYSGDRGPELLNDMYRANTRMRFQQRLAQFNRDLVRQNRLHVAKPTFTLMKLRKHDFTHYQKQRKARELTKDTGMGLYRPDTKKFPTLHWNDKPDLDRVYYTQDLMREHHEEIDDDLHGEKQFVTVKHIDDLGFKVETFETLHHHNANRYRETKKLTGERKLEIARAQRVKAENMQKAKNKAARQIFG